MKAKYYISIVFAASLLLTSCFRDNVTPNPIIGGEGDVTISIAARGVTLNDGDLDNRVVRLRLLTFDTQSGEIKGNYIFEGDRLTAPIKQVMTARLYDFVMIANEPSAVSFSLNMVDNYDGLKAIVIPSANFNEAQAIPMVMEQKGVLLRPDGTVQIESEIFDTWSVRLTRLAVRFDLKLYSREDNLSTSFKGIRFSNLPSGVPILGATYPETQTFERDYTISEQPNQLKNVNLALLTPGERGDTTWMVRMERVILPSHEFANPSLPANESKAALATILFNSSENGPHLLDWEDDESNTRYDLPRNHHFYGKASISSGTLDVDINIEAKPWEVIEVDGSDIYRELNVSDIRIALAAYSTEAPSITGTESSFQMRRIFFTSNQPVVTIDAMGYLGGFGDPLNTQFDVSARYNIALTYDYDAETEIGEGYFDISSSSVTTDVRRIYINANGLRRELEVTSQGIRWGGGDDILYFTGTGDNTTVRVEKWLSGKINIDNFAYFKLGSVIGFTNSDVESSWEWSYLKYNPSNYIIGTDITNFGSITVPQQNMLPNIPGYTNTANAGTDFSKGIRNISDPLYHNLANVNAGKGDPCRLAGISVAEIKAMSSDYQLLLKEWAVADEIGGEKWGWRMPTAEENRHFIGYPGGFAGNNTTQPNPLPASSGDFAFNEANFWVSSAVQPEFIPQISDKLPGVWLPAVKEITPNTAGGFLPTGGRRDPFNGRANLNLRIEYYSSTIRESDGNGEAQLLYIATIDSDLIISANTITSGNNMGFGLPVRCIRDKKIKPVAPDAGESVDLLYFDEASGKLQVGKWKADPGGQVNENNIMFFKFGSVVGIAATDGVQMVINDVIFNPTQGDYYTYGNVPSFDDDDWNTIKQQHINVDPREFGNSENSYHNLANVKAGKGDPCRLAGMSADEIKAMTSDYDLYQREYELAEVKGSVREGWRLPTVEENVRFVGPPNTNTWVRGTPNEDGYTDVVHFPLGFGPGDKSDFLSNFEKLDLNNIIEASFYVRNGSTRTDPDFAYFPIIEGSDSPNLSGKYLPLVGYATEMLFNGWLGMYWSSTATDDVGGHRLGMVNLAASLSLPYVVGLITVDDRESVDTHTPHNIRCVRTEKFEPEPEIWGGESDILYFADNGTLQVGHWGTEITVANHETVLALFKFGGVIGFTLQQTGSDPYWSTHNSTFWNPSQLSVSSFTTYTNIPHGDGSGHPNVSLDSHHTLARVRAGMGDPCRLVGMTPDQIAGFTTDQQLYDTDLGWRLPTARENIDFVGSGPQESGTGAQSATVWNTWQPYTGATSPSLTGNFGNRRLSGTWNNTSNFGWIDFPTHLNGVQLASGASPVYRLPAAGYRFYDGSTSYVNERGTSGAYWSSTAYNGSSGHRLLFSSNNVAPVSSGQFHNGYSVRCVKDRDVPAKLIVTPNVLNFAQDDNNSIIKSVAVTSNIPAGWVVSNISHSWITANKVNGTTLNVSVAANTGSARTGTITITSGTATATVTVNQEGLIPGVLAAPGVIGYFATGPNKGQLTLRGSVEYRGTPVEANSPFGPGTLESETVYVACFRWASLVAIGSQPSPSSVFNATNVIWAPRGYQGAATDADALNTVKTAIGNNTDITAWNLVPNRTGIAARDNGWNLDLNNGRGDPCAFYFGADGRATYNAAGNNVWRLPTGNPWNGISYTTSTLTWSNAGVLGAGLPAGRTSTVAGEVGLFLPATGNRGVGGTVSNQGTNGFYWSSTTTGNTTSGFTLSFGSGSGSTNVNPIASGDYAAGLYVRCVKEINVLDYMTDPKFRAYGEEQIRTGAWVTNKPDILSPAEAAAVKMINVVGENGNKISSLAGIEWFTGLETLVVFNHQLTELDVSNNTALVILSCGDNQLRSLDVSNNTLLTYLGCGNNQLQDLDVTRNTALTALHCYDNSLTTLDVSRNTALTDLDCGNNQLQDLDVSRNTALTSLRCYGNLLPSLNVTNNTALTRLECGTNLLPSLNVTNNTALTYLSCNSNQLTSLDVLKNTQLTTLGVLGNPGDSATKRFFINTWRDFDIASKPGFPQPAKNADLNAGQWTYNSQTIRVLYNVLDEMTDSKFRAYGVDNMPYNWDTDDNNKLSPAEAAAVISMRDISNQTIASLAGIEWFTGLTSLFCSYNSLTSLDLSKNTALTELQCYNNSLTSLILPATTALTSLQCQGNSLTSLNVSANTALTQLYCQSNSLNSLNVSNNTLLTELRCFMNPLGSLNVSNNTLLTHLNCGYNGLPSLNVSNNTLLTYLGCSSNNLTSLDVSSNTALLTLDFSNNNMGSLNVSNNTALTSLVCYSNQLPSLDVSNNTALTFINCSVNRLPSLDVSNNTALTTLVVHTNPGVSNKFVIKVWSAFNTASPPPTFAQPTISAGGDNYRGIWTCTGVTGNITAEYQK